ncbi:MAG: TetR/AcrR family transcriptional regulator [Mycobacterium sp.]
MRNRRKLVSAAREAFANQGHDVPLDEIARQAGVGATTLYRHFPVKDDLIEAVLDDLVGTLQDNADHAALIDDPLQAFRAAFTRSCDMSQRDIATFASLAKASPRADTYAQRLIVDAVGPATRRLRDAGGLRAGIDVAEIAAFIRMAITALDGDNLTKAIAVIIDGVTIV